MPTMLNSPSNSFTWYTKITLQNQNETGVEWEWKGTILLAHPVGVSDVREGDGCSTKELVAKERLGLMELNDQ